MSVVIKVPGLKEMQKSFAKAPEMVAKEIDKAIRKSILVLKAKAIPHIPVDAGFLRSRNVETFRPLRGKLENRAPYAIFVHEGTRPHFPPIHAVERWANRHGIPPFLVARAISKKGTKGKPFYDMAVRESQSIVNQIFGQALNQITLKLAK